MYPALASVRGIANLQQPRNVLRYQIPCWQNKKSAQEIDNGLGTISDIARFFGY